MKRIFIWSFTLLSVVVGLAMSLAYLNFLPPSIIWPLPVFALGFNYLLLAELAILLSLAVLRSWKALLPCFFILVNWPHVKTTLAIHTPTKVESTEQTFEVQSLNLRSFGLYGPKFETISGSKIFSFFKQQKPDIVAFQEYFESGWSKKWKYSPVDSLNAILGLKHKHIHFAVRHLENKFGLAIYSRYKIIDKGVISFDERGTNFCIWADLEVEKGKIVRLYNFHLASIHLADADYQVIENLGKDDVEQSVAGSERILKRLHNGFLRRENQVEIIRTHLDKCLHPIVICGDFNDTPQSYTYKRFIQTLNDPFLAHATGFGATYNGPIPLLRIDYILHSADLTTLDFKTHNVDVSDHFPLSAVFSKGF